MVPNGRREAKQALTRKMQLCRWAQSRAKKKGVPFRLGPEDFELPTHCPLLGIPFGSHYDNAPTLDRIVPELGYTPDNVLVISNKANRIKSNASVSEIIRVGTAYKQLIEQRSKHREYPGPS